MGNVIDGLSMILKLIAWIGSLFWKKKNIVYLNSNKKACNYDEICESRCIKYYDAKVINIGKNGSVNLKRYKSHLKVMQYHLYQIKRNLSSHQYFAYGGFVSPMFAVFDGFQIGNNVKVELVCYDNVSNAYYSIDYHRKASNSPEGIDLSGFDGREINVVISSTHKVDPTKYNSSLKTFEFEERLRGRVTNSYLQKVYEFVESVLVGTQRSKVKRINMYIAAKQPICYVIGTAIEARHPEVEVYEFVGNDYCYCLNFNTQRIRKVN